jgi:hypothetical protein
MKYQNGIQNIRIDSEIEITPLGVYVPFSTPLAGWIYKNIKIKELNKDLEEGIDYILRITDVSKSLWEFKTKRDEILFIKKRYFKKNIRYVFN